MKRILLYVPLLLAFSLVQLPQAEGAVEPEKDSEPAKEAGAEAVEAGENEEAAHRSFFDALYHLEEYKPTWKYFDWGMDERIRFDAFQNINDLDYKKDDRENLFLFRTRLWTKVKPLVDYEPLKKTEIFMRWAMEARAYTDQKEGRSFPYPGSESIIMDQLYVKFDEPWKMPMYLRAGRMEVPKNIMGDRFFFYDFTPGDNTRTIFFDGFDVGLWWPPKDRKADHSTMLQVLGAYNKNEWYAVINEDPEDQRLFPGYDRERWLMLWLTHESKYTMKQKVELFYMPYTLECFGHDEWGNDISKDLPASMRAPNFKYTPDMLIHLFGGRLSGQVFPGFFSERLSYMLQAAWQQGHIGNEALQAYSFSGKGKYEIPLPKKVSGLKPYVSSGYEVFSGDKEDTHRHEGWTWPLTRQSWRPPYGHVVRNVQQRYEGVIPFSNMQAIPVEFGWRPFCDKVKFSHWWAPLWAMEKRHKTAPDDFGDTRFKGHVLFNDATWEITKWLDLRLIFEYFKPGNFYYSDDERPNSCWFARTELNIAF